MNKFEINIEIGLSILSRMLDIEIEWDYAVIDENINNNNTKILMAYNPKTNCVIINPRIEMILESFYPNAPAYVRATLFSKLAHECRHGWQYKHPEAFKIDFKATYGILGDEYIKSDCEIDAYAFEEAILKMLLENEEAILEFPNKAPEIHTLAYKYYDAYASLFAKYI